MVEPQHLGTWSGKAMQTGQVQVYGFLFVFGAGAILLVYLLR